MENLAKVIIDEQVESTAFVIDNDNKAEWAIKKIQEEQADTQRLINVCESMILEYQNRIQKSKDSFNSNTAYLKNQLEQYFRTVPHKVTKTTESYKLPSGTLKLKLQNPEIVKDDEKLLKWVKDNSFTDYVKIKESVNWSELKETLTANGDKYLTSDGEVVDGITLIERPPVFKIET